MGLLKIKIITSVCTFLVTSTFLISTYMIPEKYKSLILSIQILMVALIYEISKELSVYWIKYEASFEINEMKKEIEEKINFFKALIPKEK